MRNVFFIAGIVALGATGFVLFRDWQHTNAVVDQAVIEQEGWRN